MTYRSAALPRLTIRLPDEATLRRIKQAALDGGQTVQDMVMGLIERHLAEVQSAAGNRSIRHQAVMGKVYVETVAAALANSRGRDDVTFVQPNGAELTTIRSVDYADLERAETQYREMMSHQANASEYLAQVRQDAKDDRKRLVLEAFEDGWGVTYKDLAEHTGLTRGQLAYTLGQLKDLGLVRRRRNDDGFIEWCWEEDGADETFSWHPEYTYLRPRGRRS